MADYWLGDAGMLGRDGVTVQKVIETGSWVLFNANTASLEFVRHGESIGIVERTRLVPWGLHLAPASWPPFAQPISHQICPEICPTLLPAPYQAAYPCKMPKRTVEHDEK